MERGQTKLSFTLPSAEHGRLWREVIFFLLFCFIFMPRRVKLQRQKDVLLPSTNLFIDISSVSEQVPTGLFFFFSGCHQFYLEPSSLSEYFKTELSLSHRALINLWAKREAGRNGARILFLFPEGLGLVWPTHMRMCIPSDTANLIYFYLSPLRTLVVLRLCYFIICAPIMKYKPLI